MSKTTIDLPNPYAPMAWMPPEVARKHTLQLYAAVGSLAVLLWDILVHIPQDYTMMTTKRLNISSLVYIIARLSGLAYVLGLVIIETAPIGNCNYIRRVSYLYAVALPFTVLLLVFRVVALYMNNKYAIAFFGLSWLAILANSIVVSMGVMGKNIGKTPYCLDVKPQTQSVFGAIGPIVHDILIFIATTWAFMRNSYTETDVDNALDIIVLGRYLPAFSKSLLRDGQLYFLATIIFNIFFLAIYLIPQSFITPCTFALPTFVLINTMSCHVYRNVRLAMHRDFTVAFPGIPSSADQQQQIGVAFSPRTRRRATSPSQEIDLESARDDSNFASQEGVDMVCLGKAELGNLKESITEKAEI